MKDVMNALAGGLIKKRLTRIYIALAGGLAKKGLVRIYWNYNKKKDIYEDCVTFYGHEKTTTSLEKLPRLPINAELDEIECYDDCCDILLK